MWTPIPYDYQHFPIVQDNARIKDISTASLIECKEQLNRCRSDVQKLASSKEAAEAGENHQWRQRVAALNPSTLIISTLKNKLGIRMCSIAWLKMYEILWHIDFAKSICGACQKSTPDQQAFATLHLCEAPGSFVASFRAYLVQHMVNHQHHLLESHHWTASTIMDTDSKMKMEAKEEFIDATKSHWVFGDLLKQETSLAIVQRASKSAFPLVPQAIVTTSHELPVVLATADGSFDNDSDPNSQETRVFPLLFAEAITQLHALSTGGTLVLKIFTFFEECTLVFLSWLTQHFARSSIDKPHSSKSTNSEHYFIGIGFRKSSSLEKEASAIGQTDKQIVALLKSSMPVDVRCLMSLRFAQYELAQRQSYAMRHVLNQSEQQMRLNFSHESEQIKKKHAIHHMTNVLELKSYRFE